MTNRDKDIAVRMENSLFLEWNAEFGQVIYESITLIMFLFL